MSDNSDYYIEKLEGESFNLWYKKGNNYFNVATLFYQDKLCGSDWNVSDVKDSVNYSETEIIDEIESPLIGILREFGDKLISMEGSNPKEVYDYFKSCLGVKNG